MWPKRVEQVAALSNSPYYPPPMSKAFTRESDGDSDESEPRNESFDLPSGSKNYVTPKGAQKLQDELRHLKHTERPQVVETVSWAASNGDRSENADYTYGKRRLRQIDKRVEFLLKRLENAEVVDPLKVICDHVRFGATVTIRDEEDREKRYSIVGVDEVDATNGKISWRSPLAHALLKAKEGDLVTVHSPRGEQEIEVVKIEYIEII